MSAIDNAYNAVLLWTTTHPREFELLRDGSVAAALFALLIVFSLKACGPKTVDPLEEAIGTVNAEVVLLKEVLTARKDDVEKLRGEMANLLSKVLNVLHLRNEDIKKLREDLTELDKNAANNTQLVLDEVTDAQHTADEAIQKEFDASREATTKQLDASRKETTKEINALKVTMDALKGELQEDINRILAWLGISPYLMNSRSESLRYPPSRLLHDLRVNQDSSEMAMRRTIEVAFPILKSPAAERRVEPTNGRTSF
jgi:hypothetical protein